MQSYYASHFSILSLLSYSILANASVDIGRLRSFPITIDYVVVVVVSCVVINSGTQESQASHFVFSLSSSIGGERGEEVVG